MLKVTHIEKEALEWGTEELLTTGIVRIWLAPRQIILPPKTFKFIYLFLGDLIVDAKGLITRDIQRFSLSAPVVKGSEVVNFMELSRQYEYELSTKNFGAQFLLISDRNPNGL